MLVNDYARCVGQDAVPDVQSVGILRTALAACRRGVPQQTWPTDSNAIKQWEPEATRVNAAACLKAEHKSIEAVLDGQQKSRLTSK